ncbi:MULTISPECIES: carbohydrate ABC transporter permease [unclassified Microbacterium]|uniref:carbohydrate ABC transporter permease n=1 Tax=unclassified Microbacterium TaxID=2609290 RepID=UPI0030163E49
MTRKRFAAKGLVYAIIAVFLVVQVYPIAWVLLSSLKTPGELADQAPFALPSSFYVGNYISAFAKADLGRYLLNSTIVVVLTIGLTIAVGAPAAFAIEKLRFRGSRLVLGYFLLGIMIPVFVALLPMFQIFNELGLRNTYWALVLPQVGFNLPICIFLYTGFMKYIPDSLMEAAKLDGASTWRIFARVVFPLSTNTTVTIIIYNFIFVWNEFVFANTFMNSATMKTLPVGLNDYVGLYGKTDFGATYAAIVIAILPTLILYFVLNRRVIEGMAAGAVRG